MKIILLILITIIVVVRSSPSLRSIRKIVATTLASTIISPSIALLPSYASNLDDYLVRDIDFEVDQKKPLRLSLIQGFAALKGKKPATGGGDRTGTYTWPGGIELSTNVLNHNIVDVKNKRVLDLGTGTGVVGLAAVFGGASKVALTDGG